MLRHRPHGRAVDFYSIGAILYEMLTGLPPHYDTDRRILYRNILREELCFPPFVSSEAQSIIQALLHRDHRHRLGSKRGMEEVKQHPFCRGIDWEGLLRKEIKPPLRPDPRMSHFDP